MREAYKTCSCGAGYTKQQWEALKCLGVQRTEDETHVYYTDMRNCLRCGSTMGIDRAVPKKV